jgi:hypothetical protein
MLLFRPSWQLLALASAALLPACLDSSEPHVEAHAAPPTALDDERSAALAPAVPSSTALTPIDEVPETRITPITTLTLSSGLVVNFYRAENELTIGASGPSTAPMPAALTRLAPMDPVAIYRELSGRPAPSVLVAAVAAAYAIPDDGSADDGESPIPPVGSAMSSSAVLGGEGGVEATTSAAGGTELSLAAPGASAVNAASCYSANSWEAHYCADLALNPWFDQRSCHPVLYENKTFHQKGHSMWYAVQANTEPLHIHFRYKKGTKWKASIDQTILPCSRFFWISECLGCVSRRWRKAQIVNNDEGYSSRFFAGNHE